MLAAQMVGVRAAEMARLTVEMSVKSMVGLWAHHSAGPMVASTANWTAGHSVAVRERQSARMLVAPWVHYWVGWMEL